MSSSNYQQKYRLAVRLPFNRNHRRDSVVRRPPRSQFVCVASCIIVIVVLVQTNAVQSGQDDLPKGFREALVSNAQALGTIGIKFTVRREYRVSGLPRAKRDDIYTYLADGKFFQRRARTLPTPGSGGDQVIEGETSFDGNIFYLGTRYKEGGGSLIKMLGENPEDPQTRNTYTNCPYFEAVGFSLPETVPEWKNSAVASTVVQLTSDGKITGISKEGSTLTISLRIPEPCVAAARKLDLDELANQMRRSKSKPDEISKQIDAYRRVRSLDWFRQVKLWLDTEKGFAVKRRQDLNPDGRLIQTIECDNFQYTEQASLWLPRNCTVKTYVKSPQLLNEFTNDPNETDQLELQEVSFEPRKDISFSLDYGPGTFITDHSIKAAKASPFGAKTYLIPGGKDDLRNAANARLGRGRGIFLTVNIIALLVLIGLFVVRRRANRRHA